MTLGSPFVTNGDITPEAARDASQFASVLFAQGYPSPLGIITWTQVSFLSLESDHIGVRLTGVVQQQKTQIFKRNVCAALFFQSARLSPRLYRDSRGLAPVRCRLDITTGTPGGIHIRRRNGDG